MKCFRYACLAIGVWGLASPVAALVRLDEGALIVDGVQLLREYADEKTYRYVPQYPRLARKIDGSWELLCMKYVDAAGGSNGGLFHALVEFSLPPGRVEELQELLQREVPGARIAGPVELMESVEEGEEGVGSFRVVSATLSPDSGRFTQSLISSGRAPLLPGSKAAIAALLEPEGATLLWDSFQGPTSDVSVAISAYFMAAVQGYNARVQADMSTVYTHFSKVRNKQAGFEKKHIRKVVDDLVRSGDLKVEVLDSSVATGVEADDMKQILQLVTDRLTDVMFDLGTGWSAEPQRTEAAGTGPGRSDNGAFVKFFAGKGSQSYVADDSYVLKDRKDIRRNSFSLNLDKNATIRVPLNTAGNLGALYEALGEDPSYFRIVNLEDPDFEFREVHFQVDGEYVDAFKQALNFVSVNFRKLYEDRPAFTRTITFNHAEIEAGKNIRGLSFPRLGARDPSWTEYEYQVRWSLRDGPTLSVPSGADGEADAWLRSGSSGIALTPPFRREIVEIEADRSGFGAAGFATAVVEFASILGGERRIVGRRTLRAGDADPVTQLSLYHDRDSPVAYRVSWFGARRSERGDLELLPDANFLFLVPPVAEPSEASP